MVNIKSNLVRKIKGINSYGYKNHKPIVTSALKKHKISFDFKVYNVNLSELRAKMSDLKKEHRLIREKKLENILNKKKVFDLEKLSKKSISIKIEIAKLETLENLILQSDLLKTTPELKPKYNKFIKDLFSKIDQLYSGNNYKRYLYYPSIMKTITTQIKLRNPKSRLRLFNYVTKEILNTPLNQLKLDL